MTHPMTLSHPRYIPYHQQPQAGCEYCGEPFECNHYPIQEEPMDTNDALHRQTYHVTVHLWVDERDAEHARAWAIDRVLRGISVSNDDVEAEEWDESK